MSNSDFHELLRSIAKDEIFVIDPTIEKASYVHLDLSSSNEALEQLDLSTSSEMTSYILDILRERRGQVGYGGYLEQRSIYKRSESFNDSLSESERNIHLGLDLWVEAGTSVRAALKGRVHSFSDNVGLGDYGPTIILEHEIDGLKFYSLYGHLSRASLTSLEKGRLFRRGEEIAKLGEAFENGDYAPHLHFQLILDMEGKSGDYPGVCSSRELQHYRLNCPDPSLLLFN